MKWVSTQSSLFIITAFAYNSLEVLSSAGLTLNLSHLLSTLSCSDLLSMSYRKKHEG